MRCLFVVPSLMRAGAEIQAVTLANELSRLGHSVHLFSFGRELDQRDQIASSVSFHHALRKSKFDVTLISKLADVIDREEIEVVQGVLNIATLFAWLAAKRSVRRPPVVAAVHTTLNRGIKEELQERLIYSRLFMKLPAVVFVCQYQRDHWARKYSRLKPRAHVVHNGIAHDRFRQSDFIDTAAELRARHGIASGACVFSCISAFRPEKGHDLLIQAFSKVPSDTYLLLAGDGRLRPAIEEQVRAANIQRRVRFLGILDDPRPVMAASTATILASTAVETFSLAMLESMALGVPMIAPKIGGLPEAIVHGETGLLFPIGDADALAVHMRSLALNPDLAERMGAAAHRKIADHFNVENMAAGSERVLLQAIGAEA